MNQDQEKERKKEEDDRDKARVDSSFKNRNKKENDIADNDDDGWLDWKDFNKKSNHNYEKNKNCHHTNNKAAQGRCRGLSGSREGEGGGERSQVYNQRQPKQKSYVYPQ